ncbi:PP2C family protein-serine/threonine phosphatase [Ostreiculturibacter nitratireducens]|uniref:PP2C family protein-serine/threonine phosphatase n=1 Tax=Ostreiculturibacter nitratireducens TaxID=3075226 RepID=UPI0031B5D812
MNYDVATALSRGQRDYQEDAVIADFSVGADFGFAVLGDGMGGHAAGDVASKIVVTEVFAELKFQSGAPEVFEGAVADMLLSAAETANAAIAAQVAEDSSLHGMGSTLVAPVIFKDRLYWISIGDSPLYLYRDGTLRQINEDHSMGPQIDLMVKTGQLAPELARDHPDRNLLRSVVMGARISMIDCKPVPTKLLPGDTVIAASDGIQYLTDEEIVQVLAETKAKSSDDTARALLAAVNELDDPEQDNVALVVVKLSSSG